MLCLAGGLSSAGVLVKRTMNLSYPVLDSIFIVALIALIALKKQYRLLVWSLCGGVLYFIVDYLMFHLIAGARFFYWGSDPNATDAAAMAGILIWMSMSYGFTNFMLVYLALDRDEHLIGYAALVMLWWVACPQISDMFASAAVFTIGRSTGNYHGVMGGILFFAYACVIVYNMRVERYKRINIVWLLMIGILVQFGWEFSLLISGIRSDGLSFGEALRTLTVNSLTETNLGMPSFYLLYVFVNRTLDRRKATRLGIEPICLMAGKTYAPRLKPQEPVPAAPSAPSAEA